MHSLYAAVSQDEHWTALFKKLGMPKTVRLDTLSVGHIIDAMDAVAANLAWLKDLHSRAQGEVTLREALAELKAWCETTDFKLMEHVSSVSGRKTGALMTRFSFIHCQAAHIILAHFTLIL